MKRILIIFFYFMFIIELNYFFQPLLNYYFIDKNFFITYPYIFCLYLMVLAILSYFITYLLHKVLSRYFYKEKKQLTEEFLQIESMKEYTSKIEDLYLNIRSFKHDYINILSSFYTYINERNYEGLEKYFNQEILPASSNLAYEDSVYGRLGLIQAPEIKSILYTKILDAKKYNIKVTTEIKEKIDNFPINILDLVRVLGILLDNAIEASSLTKRKFLCIFLFTDAEGIYIQIQNSSVQIDNIEKLYQKEISSKGDGHGIGLYEVRKIVNGYSNILLHTEYNDFVFYQKLTLLYI